MFCLSVRVTEVTIIICTIIAIVCESYQKFGLRIKVSTKRFSHPTKSENFEPKKIHEVLNALNIFLLKK